MCPCKIVIKQGTKPVRCTDCCTLYHKRCTGLSRDSQDAAADGLIRWYCDKCHSLREKENEDITPNIHLEDAPESLSQTIKKNVLSVVNAWGVKGKLDELEERLNKDEIDICLIQETKLKEGRDKTPVIPGYKFIRSDRTGASGGGLAILVKKNISYEEVKRAQKGGTEVLEIRVKMTQKTWLGLTNIYISPLGNVGFSTEMRLDAVSTNGIVAGDFNGHSELWDENIQCDDRGEEILSWATEHDLTILNDGSPTRLNPSTGAPSSPDITLADSKWASKCQWGVGECIGASDHLPIYTKVISAVATQKTAKRRPKWKRNVDWSKFTEEVEENIDQVLPCLSMKEKVEKFNKVLIEAGKKHVGKVQPGGRRKTCITPPVRAAIRRRNQLRKDMRNNGQEWKEAAQEVKQLKLEAKEKAWKDYLDEAINEKDDSKVYKIIRSLNGTPDTNSTNEALVHKNRTITSDVRKADTFIQHYAAVSRHTFSKEERDLNREVKKILSRSPTDNTGACSDFTMSELNKAIKKMNKKSAPGEDDIPSTFLAALGTKAKIILLDILNFSFSTGQVPQI